MLACELNLSSYNGNVSTLYPKMQTHISNTHALQHMLAIDEFRDKFDKWYTKGGIKEGAVQGRYDENAEPILIDDAYFENPIGERYYIRDSVDFAEDGSLISTPYQERITEFPEAKKAMVENFMRMTQEEKSLLPEGQVELIQKFMENSDTLSKNDFSFYQESKGQNSKDFKNRNSIQYQLPQGRKQEEFVASEKTIRDLAARMSDRIGIPVRFESDRTKEYKGKIENNVAVINLAYATLDTPIHEILGHPIIRAIRNKKHNDGSIDSYNDAMAEFYENNPSSTREEAIKYADKKVGNNQVDLYNNLVKELDYGIGKQVLDRIKRDYIDKPAIFATDDYGNETHLLSESSDYTLEEQQEEAIVELLGLYTADRLDKVKDGKLISLLKRLLKEIKAFVKNLLIQREVEIDKLPDNMTLGDIADLLAYSNSKLILPGNEVVYTTPDNQQFKTYAEASKHISELAKSVKEVDLSNINIRTEEETYSYYYMDRWFNTLEEAEQYKKDLNIDTLDTIEKKKTHTSIKEFLVKNKEYEQSKEIIEEWKRVNNIRYNPEEIYSRGQEFISVLGAYSDFDVNLMMQNLLEHIEDNKKAGGNFSISAITKPIDKKIGHLEGGGGKIRFKIYPKSNDILWASNVDVYSGSVWDASEKVNKDKKSELLGVSYTKYPSLRTIYTVQPNLSSIVDNLAHHHNELGITLTGSNFRLDYDDNIPFQTKKIINGINSILDQKHGKLVKPEIKPAVEKRIKAYAVIYNGVEQMRKETKKEAEDFLKLHASKRNKSIDEYRIEESYFVRGYEGLQPNQTEETLKENINSIKDRINRKNIVTVKGETGEYYIESAYDSYGEINNGNIDLFYDLYPIDDFDPITNPNGQHPLFNIPASETNQKLEKKKQYDSQAIVNTKIARLKEVAKKYPRSLIRSEVKPIDSFEQDLGFNESELPFQKLRSKQDVKSVSDSANDFSLYQESKDENRKLTWDDAYKAIRKAIFLPHQSAKFDRIVSGLEPDSVTDVPELRDPETGKEMTYWQYHDREQSRYLREQEYLEGLLLRQQLSPFFTMNEFYKDADNLYDTYRSLPFLEHVERKDFRNFWQKEIQMTDSTFKKIWIRMATKIGGTHKTIRQHYGQLYRDFSDHAAFTMKNDLIESIHGPGSAATYVAKPQSDITELQTSMQSIVDFNDEQLVIQRLGRLTQTATGKAENEVSRMKYELNKKMGVVASNHWSTHMDKRRWAFLRGNMFKVLFNRVETHNKPFEWMYIKTTLPADPSDPLGPTTHRYENKMIQRFFETEDQVKAFIYEQDIHGNYVHKIEDLIELMRNSNTSRNAKFLTTKELVAMRQMIDFIDQRNQAMLDGVWLKPDQKVWLKAVELKLSKGQVLSAQDQDFYDQINLQKANGFQLSAKQERFMEHVQRYGRRLASRVRSVQKDTDFFEMLQEESDNGNAVAIGKIDLYDYLYKKNLEYAEVNDNSYGQPLDRVFMPQLSMNVYEAYQRPGLGLMSAYIRFVVNLNNVDLFSAYNVEHDAGNGLETKTWEEWTEYYKDDSRTRAQKLKAPFILKKLYKNLERDWANGKSPDPLNRMQFASSMAVSNSMPFRTVAKKSDFSINTSRIFLVHFESMIFRKHHKDLVPLFQAAKTFYQNEGGKTGRQQDFQKNQKFIEDYADRYFMGHRRGAFNNTIAGNMVDQLLTATVLSYLAASPETSLMNIGVGMNEALRQKIATHGWTQGPKQFALGLSRMTGVDPKKGNVLSAKGKAFIEHFNLETFSNIDIENQQDFFFGMGDKMMYLQKQGEVIIRGTSILGEMTDAQWNSFVVNNDGYLRVTDNKNFPDLEKVKEWNYYVSSVQGNYTPEGRRNYHNFVLLKAAMLFKGWLFDYLGERFRPTFTDQYGKKRQGYYLSMWEIAGTYVKTIGNMKDFAEVHGKLELHHVENLRKIVYDLSMYVLLMSASTFMDDEDDPALVYLKSLMLKFHSQIFLQFNPEDMLKMISRPFPMMGMVESFAGSVSAFGQGKFDKSAELMKSTLPGHRIYDFTLDMGEIIE